MHSKKKSMNFDKNKSDEELIPILSGLDYQWIKGDLIGSVEKFESIESTDEGRFIVFHGNSRINMDLVDEYMDSFPSHHPEVQINDIIENIELKGIQESKEIIQENKVNESVESKGLLNVDSPIHALLSKQKQNKKRVDISISLDLPSKSLFSVLSDSFDDAESDIIEYALSNLDPEDIRKSLKVSIRKMYEKNSRAKTDSE
jgi:hypothetical protein